MKLVEFTGVFKKPFSMEAERANSAIYGEDNREIWPEEFSEDPVTVNLHAIQYCYAAEREGETILGLKGADQAIKMDYEQFKSIFQEETNMTIPSYVV